MQQEKSPSHCIRQEHGTRTDQANPSPEFSTPPGFALPNSLMTVRKKERKKIVEGLDWRLNNK